ncbi:MAG: phosphoribosyl-AMP cyclohydrolase [Kiritimatiellae bacterium]|nr:phosphoribosyl-AMP cyclohydrolase [Kiritimatiellia bacterium]
MRGSARGTACQRSGYSSQRWYSAASRRHSPDHSLGGAHVNELEEGTNLQLDFAKLKKIAALEVDVLPVVVQNADTGEVILLAYANEEALQASVAARSAVFWSTSRNELWEKGQSSGETFALVEIRVNCEQNSLLYRVRPRRGGICHTKNRQGAPRNCFYRRIRLESLALENLDP